MIVATAIAWLMKYPALVVTGMVDTIVAMMTGNVNFESPLPKLGDVTTANEAAKTAIANAVNGGRELTAIKNEKMDELAGLIRPLASYVTVTSAGDLTKLLSSGFPIQKPTRHPIGPLSTPTAPIVRPGFMHGMVLAETGAIDGAYIYNWRAALASAPTVYVRRNRRRPVCAWKISRVVGSITSRSPWSAHWARVSGAMPVTSQPPRDKVGQ